MVVLLCTFWVVPPVVRGYCTEQLTPDPWWLGEAVKVRVEVRVSRPSAVVFMLCCSRPPMLQLREGGREGQGAGAEQVSRTSFPSGTNTISGNSSGPGGVSEEKGWGLMGNFKVRFNTVCVSVERLMDPCISDRIHWLCVSEMRAQDQVHLQ